MEKDLNIILGIVKNFNLTATKDERKLLAMYLSYNITMEACENHWEAIGVLFSTISEIQNEFTKPTSMPEKINENLN